MSHQEKIETIEAHNQAARDAREAGDFKASSGHIRQAIALLLTLHE